MLSEYGDLKFAVVGLQPIYGNKSQESIFLIIGQGLLRDVSSDWSLVYDSDGNLVEFGLIES